MKVPLWRLRAVNLVFPCFKRQYVTHWKFYLVLENPKFNLLAMLIKPVCLRSTNCYLHFWRLFQSCNSLVLNSSTCGGHHITDWQFMCLNKLHALPFLFSNSVWALFRPSVHPIARTLSRILLTTNRAGVTPEHAQLWTSERTFALSTRNTDEKTLKRIYPINAIVLILWKRFPFQCQIVGVSRVSSWKYVQRVNDFMIRKKNDNTERYNSKVISVPKYTIIKLRFYFLFIL